MTAHNGVDVDRVGPWIAEHVPGWVAPVTAELIAGGKSNLTFRVADAAGNVAVLRRPPLAGVLRTAHDMLREHRILAALEPTPVPTPGVLAACDDPDVTGAPFYVMELVEGHVLAEPADAEPLDEVARRRAGLSLVEALAALHAVDVDAVGLGGLAKREDYVARQLKRWLGQFHDSRTQEIPAIERVHDRLLERIPPQQGDGVVHGDYRLGNVVVDDGGEVRGILDWELCTLGDPLADVGFVLATWATDDPRDAVAVPAGNALPGFATRDELAERYATASGRDLAGIGFYVALAYWRLACIVEGVYSRALRGAQGDKALDLDLLRRRPVLLAELAEEAAAGS